MLPLWSAAVDPHVLPARASRTGSPGARPFDASAEVVRAVRSRGREHLLVERNGMVTRLDIIDGTSLAGPVVLHFDLADDPHLERRIAAIRSFTASTASPRLHRQLARRLHALQAVDARDLGASLREIAERVLGPGDWPGDGEHRKSHVRRMIAAGERMISAGPRAVLGG
ncbi:DNA -binding domain-containing protein [Flavisphingomonas formosensis]|uniref:DNA -binding domain-containing protein n=1 Tax=Flavisphingomonas formosensis TaxID=861534 RepID=UPI0012F74C0E|nr:DUF2285 domain-containing protein [Sphingomonas formosensis]